VFALEETDTLEIDAATVEQTLLSNPRIAGTLLRMLSRRVRSTDELAALIARRASVSGTPS
jgi:CRP-like cAMP-binding protein